MVLLVILSVLLMLNITLIAHTFLNRKEEFIRLSNSMLTGKTD